MGLERHDELVPRPARGRCAGRALPRPAPLPRDPEGLRTRRCRGVAAERDGVGCRDLVAPGARTRTVRARRHVAARRATGGSGPRAHRVRAAAGSPRLRCRAGPAAAAAGGRIRRGARGRGAPRGRAALGHRRARPAARRRPRRAPGSGPAARQARSGGAARAGGAGGSRREPGLAAEAAALAAPRRDPGRIHQPMGARRADPPRDRAAARVQEALPPALGERVELARRMDRPGQVPARLRAGGGHHRTLGLVRRRCAAAAPAAAQRGPLRPGLAPRGRRRGTARAARARRHGARRGARRGRARP